MARDIYYDKMMYNSTKFTFRNGHIKEGFRVIEFLDDGKNIYRYSDFLFKESWLEAQDEKDQIQIGSNLEGKEVEYMLIILGIVNNDVYYGLYKKKDDGSQNYSLVENGYINSEESLNKNICLENEDHFFSLSFQCPEIGFEPDDFTTVVE